MILVTCASVHIYWIENKGIVPMYLAQDYWSEYTGDIDNENIQLSEWSQTQDLVKAIFY